MDVMCPSAICIAGWSSLVARRAHNPKVVGSNPAPATINLRPCGQAVKTPPFHGGIPSSILGRVTIIRTHSSVGRASALQAGGHRFEPYCVHQNGLVVQLVRMPACHAGGRRFESDPGRHYISYRLCFLKEELLISCHCAGVAQLVEQLICNQ